MLILPGDRLHLRTYWVFFLPSQEGAGGIGPGATPDPDMVPFLCTRIPGSWNLEELQALGPLTTYISPQLWEQVQEVQWGGVRTCGLGSTQLSP